MFETLSNLTDHCSYEFCYAYRFDSEDEATHWNSDSIFVSWNHFMKLTSYIDHHIEIFPYYMPPFRMSNDLWNKIKTFAIEESEDRSFVLEFFEYVDTWKQNDPNNADFFWIIGV